MRENDIKEKHIYNSKVNLQIKNSLKSFERIYLFLLTIIDANSVVWLDTVIIIAFDVRSLLEVLHILFVM